MNGRCKQCRKDIKVMIFQDQDYCSDDCRKVLDLRKELVNGGKSGTKRR